MTTHRIPIEPQPVILKDRIRPSGCPEFVIEWKGVTMRSFGGSEVTLESLRETRMEMFSEHCPHQPGDRLPGDRLPCECVSCCEGEHAGSCKECAGWRETDGVPCEHCSETGVCPVCDGEAAEQVVESVSVECVEGVWNWKIETRDEA